MGLATSRVSSRSSRGRTVARASSSAMHRWPSELKILRVATQSGELVVRRGAVELAGGRVSRAPPRALRPVG
jgi:hypothetical protein